MAKKKKKKPDKANDKKRAPQPSEDSCNEKDTHSQPPQLPETNPFISGIGSAADATSRGSTGNASQSNDQEKAPLQPEDSLHEKAGQLPRDGGDSAVSGEKDNSANTPSLQDDVEHAPPSVNADVVAALFDSLREKHMCLLCGKRFRLKSHEAEDVIQQAAVKALKSRSRKPITNPEAWICRIVINAAKDWLKRHGRQPNIVRLIPDMHPADEGSGVDAATREVVYSAMGKLNEREAPIIEFWLEGLNDREIGERLRLPTKTIYNRRKAVLRKLRGMLPPDLLE
jgi:RNA polymerase sigma factor (sigma-70 family)